METSPLRLLLSAREVGKERERKRKWVKRETDKERFYGGRSISQVAKKCIFWRDMGCR